MSIGLHVIKNEVIKPGVPSLADFQKEMMATIKNVDEYSWNKDKLGGYSFGDWQMDNAFGGLKPHMYLIAGSPNIGKQKH